MRSPAPLIAHDDSVIPGSTLRRLIWLWLAFCVARIVGGTLLYYLDHKSEIWPPVLWESSSLLVATLIVVLHLKITRSTRTLVGQPWRWLIANLSPLPLWCLIFTPLTYGIRHGVYALLGRSYQHPTWSMVLLYESLQLSLFFLLWLGVVFALTGQERLRSETEQRERVELALREANLALLRQQLQPHFLFNALNLISATMYENVPKADALLRHLSNLLRQSIASNTAIHRVHEELALLRAYGEIMAARFEDRVKLDWQVAPELENCFLPAMIAQPLLENAFKYGVEPLSGMTQLSVRVDGAIAGKLRLQVAQDRGRFAPEVDHGHGLRNIRARLSAHFAEAAELHVENLVPEGVCVTLLLPCAS